jgi:hypothetical protein
MEFGLLFLGFLQKIAVGAASVLALLLIIWLGMPRRARIAVSRRTTR